MPLELALVNGRIHTLDPQRPRVEAIGISNGRIVMTGTTHDIRDAAGPGTRIVDLNGGFVMPGFIDAHLHFEWGARYLDDVGVRDARTFADVLARLARYAAERPDKTWILGQEFSYGYPDLPNGAFHKSFFDALVPDRPVFFHSGMAHAAWANSKALELAGIGRDTPDPQNGVIVRDAQGEPTGWLKEHAIHMVQALVPPPSGEDRERSVKAAIAEASRLGITRVQSAGFDGDIVPILARMRDGDALGLRFTLSAVCDPDTDLGALLEGMRADRERYSDDMLDMRVLKFFLDGVLESHTGYMPEGYADKPDERGILLWDPAAYGQAVRLGQENGFQVWTHAIGTGAIATALDAYEADGERSRVLRPRVEHVEIPSASDIERFARIGAIASFQPAMIYPRDQWMGMEGIWERRVGANRMALGFPIRAILDAGGAVAFGTDWPIVDLNPLVGIRNAVLRQSIDGVPPEGWLAAQRIALDEAIRAYTSDAAFAGHRENAEGSIVPGKLADIVVLSRDPGEGDPQHLHEIEVRATLVGGKLEAGALS